MSNYLHMETFLSASDAQQMLHIAESVASFGTYADEASSDGLGEQLPQRFDVGKNYVAAGLDGSGNQEPAELALSRTNYFRETYAYGDDVRAEGIQAFMSQPLLKDAASRISGCTVIEPAIVYANLLIPGQELAIHTDVPEFRGANRQVLPQWLLVCMLHSGLFEAWRIPIMTCVSWFGAATGGAFTFYPDGASGSRQSIPAKHNSAIILDTDQVFHGVERVNQVLVELPAIGKSTRLHYCGDGHWQLREEQQLLAEYDWPQLRYSVSWKAYCFRDEEQAALWREGAADLSLAFILDVFESELARRGALSGGRPEPTEFALMLADTFIQFPAGHQH